MRSRYRPGLQQVIERIGDTGTAHHPDAKARSATTKLDHLQAYTLEAL